MPTKYFIFFPYSNLGIFPVLTIKSYLRGTPKDTKTTSSQYFIYELIG